jgi:hypothetical protein
VLLKLSTRTKYGVRFMTALAAEDAKISLFEGYRCRRGDIGKNI